MPEGPRIYIDSVERTTQTRALRRLSVSYTLGGRGVARFQTLDTDSDTENAYRPDVNELAEIKTDTSLEVLFTGTTLNVKDEPLGSPNVGVVMSVDATDYTRAMDGRILSGIQFNGQTLKQIVTAIRDTYLWMFSINVDTGMASGPTFDTVTFDGVTATEALNRLSVESGWVWRLTPDRIIEFFAPGTKTAGFSLTSSNSKILGAVRWTKPLRNYANSVILQYGTERLVAKTQTFSAATAGQTTWTLDYPASGVNLRGYITVDGAFIPISTFGVHDSGVHPWQWDAANNAIRRTPGASGGEVVSVTYDVQFPLTVTASNSAASTEPWDKIITAPDVFDKDQAQSLADGLLARYEVQPRTLTIRTREGFELPGTSMTITVPERTVSGSWLIMSTTIRDDVDGKLTYEYECAEDESVVDSWLQSFRSSGSATGSSTVSGAVLPALTGNFDGQVVANDTDNSSMVLVGQVPSMPSKSQAGGTGVWIRESELNEWAIVLDSGGSPSNRILLQDKTTTNAYGLRLGLTGGVYQLEPGNSASFDLGVDSLGRRFNEIHGVDIAASSAFYERGRTVAMGEYTQVTFSAGHYTGNGSMTWTVASGNVNTFQYRIIGKSMLVNVYIVGGTVGGTPNTELLMTIPGGYTANKQVRAGARILNNGADSPDGQVVVSAGGTTMRIFADESFATNWTAGSVAAQFSIEFEVQ